MGNIVAKMKWILKLGADSLLCNLEKNKINIILVTLPKRIMARDMFELDQYN